jgi:hypothetical protein
MADFARGPTVVLDPALYTLRETAGESLKPLSPSGRSSVPSNWAIDSGSWSDDSLGRSRFARKGTLRYQGEAKQLAASRRHADGLSKS